MNKTAVKKPINVAGHLHPVADAYARWTLDCVIELVTGIADNYLTRYREYRAVPENMSKLLAEFRTRTGSDPEWPNTAQRTAIFTPLFGASDRNPESDPTASFHQLAEALRAAAVAYSERVYNTGEPMLRKRFLRACRDFRAHLSTLSGSVVDESRRQTKPMFERATQVLRTPQVAQAFGGLPPVPGKSWPMPQGRDTGEAYLDGDAAYLIEEISRCVGSAHTVSRQSFLMLQQVSVDGSVTIDDTLDNTFENDDDKLKELIGNTYIWSTTLRDLAGNASATGSWERNAG